MKAIHYDAEGDILTVTFRDPSEYKSTGVELSDNLVLYYEPETAHPLRLILISYQAMLEASTERPIPLDGLDNLPANVRAVVMNMLEGSPLNTFLQVTRTQDDQFFGRLQAIFTPSTLETVAAA